MVEVAYVATSSPEKRDENAMRSPEMEVQLHHVAHRSSDDYRVLGRLYGLVSHGDDLCLRPFGKLLGAGGGGFLLFYIEPDKKEALLKEFDELMHVPFEFEDEGTSVVHYNPIVYIPRKELNLNFD